ncbi:hypothetical protein NKJ72_09970 [Mesorhizobium sp. M0045]|uniref:hypothetical protein n=1 Tax=Mesorhizobium sp. M0045 TaxID=2956857 RepID=UPI0033367EAF
MWVQTVTVRTVLRIFPLSGGLFEGRGQIEKELAGRLFLKVLRATTEQFVVGTEIAAEGNIPFMQSSAAMEEATSYVSPDDQLYAVFNAMELASRAAAFFDKESAVFEDDDVPRAVAWRTVERAIAACGGKNVAAIWRALSNDINYLEQSQLGSIGLRSEKLWLGNTPDWAFSVYNSLARNLRRQGEGWEIWSGWYRSRLDGRPSYGLGPREGEAFDGWIATRGSEFWNQSPVNVNLAVAAWVEARRTFELDQKNPTIGQFIIRFLEERKEPASIGEISRAFEEAGLSVVPKTVRGDLSRLASAGQIQRVGNGIYQAANQINVVDIGRAEPQTQGAIQFAGHEDAPIDVVPRGSAGKLRNDVSAQKRHREVLRRAEALLAHYSRAEQGGNASSAVVDEVSLFRDSLGSSIEDVDPDLLIPRGDGLRHDLAAHQGRDDFSKLAPLPDDLLLSLRKLISDYNNFVSFDAELARRDEALLGPDARRKLVPPAEGQKVLEQAVQLGAAAANVVAVLSEEAKVAPEVPDPESRQSRRYSEGAKNFARIAIERATDFARLVWKHKGKAVTGAGFGYCAAQWVVGHESWLLKYFAANPTMLDVIAKLLRALHELPLT